MKFIGIKKVRFPKFNLDIEPEKEFEMPEAQYNEVKEHFEGKWFKKAEVKKAKTKKAN